MSATIEALKSDDALQDYIARQSQSSQEQTLQISTFGTQTLGAPGQDFNLTNIQNGTSVTINGPNGTANSQNSMTVGGNQNSMSATTGSLTSNSSFKRNSHMGIPLNKVGRDEPIACHTTGKRSACASDDQIRVYVKFPMSGDRKNSRNRI